jgi:hypothetical protein
MYLYYKIIEEVSCFKYLGCCVTYGNEKDIAEKITSFNSVVAVINQVFKPNLIQKHTRKRVYKTLMRSVLIYGSKAWAICKREESRITAAEMKFMRQIVGYICMDFKRIRDVMKEVNTEPVMNFTQT